MIILMFLGGVEGIIEVSSTGYLARVLNGLDFNIGFVRNGFEKSWIG